MHCSPACFTSPFCHHEYVPLCVLIYNSKLFYSKLRTVPVSPARNEHFIDPYRKYPSSTGERTLNSREFSLHKYHTSVPSSTYEFVYQPGLKLIHCLLGTRSIIQHALLCRYLYNLHQHQYHFSRCHHHQTKSL